MFESFKQTNEPERAILRRLRVWIAGLAAVCVLTGIGIGAILAGRPAVAQDELQAAARAPEALSASFVEIAKRVEPAVVNIDTMQASTDLAETDNDDKSDRTPSNPLYDMLRRQPPRPTRGVGSGLIFDPKGYILTNNHVIEGANRISIGLITGERFRGKVVGVDLETDLAVIKIDAGRDLPVMKLGDSTTAQVGDWVLAIGSPFGLEQTVTAGIISKKERQPYPGANFQQFIQTDAAINRGNSGGPLVNMHGEAIGVNSQIATLTGDYNGIGFALPSNEAKFVCEQILTNGKVKRGFLGVNLESVHGEYARIYSLPEAKGAIITDVQQELQDHKGQTPAAKAGLQANDVIVEFNGQPVQDAQDLIAKVAGTAVGQNVTITYLREIDGKLDRHTVTVTLGERPPPRDGETSLPKEKDGTAKTVGARLGLTLSELTPQLITEKHLNGVKGLYIKEVDPNGLSAEFRPNEIVAGKVITRINRVPVTTLAEFTRVIESLKPGDAIVLNLSVYDRGSDRVVQQIVQFTYQ